jgi:hypothetical protein
MQDMIGNAAAILLDTQRMHVRFSSTGIPGLTASVYDAEVTANPPHAVGDATLLVDDKPVHASFTVADGKLIVGTEDRGTTDMGDAAGKLNPPALLDREHGLSALVSSIRDVSETESSGIDTRSSQVRLEGKLPTNAAALLLPRQVFPSDVAETHTTVWLDPAQQGRLVQMLIVVGNGSATLQLNANPAIPEVPPGPAPDAPMVPPFDGPPPAPPVDSLPRADAPPTPSSWQQAPPTPSR